MAKSERKSKWKRKMRALKRIKNEPKEMARLAKILPKLDINMEDMEKIANGIRLHSISIDVCLKQHLLMSSVQFKS
jgi:hypothetical protein